MQYRAAKTFIINELKTKLSSNLTYHGIHHTLDVLAVTRALCVSERVERRDVLLLKTAALFHDSGFTRSTREHEQHGCDIARTYLPQFGYEKADIETICGMIMATKIPQSPKTRLETILCDADLDYLGREDFYPIGKTLFEELKYLGVLTSEQAWNRLQINFLTAHKFCTQTNLLLREPVKQLYLNELRMLVATY
jgi:predicted metal-dependent HD superfamily phosphohydrolase